MDIVCDEKDPHFWPTVLTVCDQSHGGIVRLSVCRELQPRGETIQIHRTPCGKRTGPIGLVISSESSGIRECVVVAAFARLELMAFARQRVEAFRA